MSETALRIPAGAPPPWTAEEVRELHVRLGAVAAGRVKALAAALEVFKGASGKKEAARAIARRLGPLGVKGLSMRSPAEPVSSTEYTRRCKQKSTCFHD